MKGKYLIIPRELYRLSRAVKVEGNLIAAQWDKVYWGQSSGGRTEKVKVLGRSTSISVHFGKQWMDKKFILDVEEEASFLQVC